MLRRIVACTFLFLFSCFPAGTASASDPARPVDDLRQSILALDSAWTRAQTDLQQKKAGGVLQDSEQRDYAKFITYLSGRIADYCRQLRTAGGEQAVIGLPCPGEVSLPAGGGGPVPPSRAEQVASLDKELTEALGEFDQQLLREEERLASRIPAERESGGGYGSAGAGGGHGTRGLPRRQGQAGTGNAGGGSAAGTGGQGSTGGQIAGGPGGSGPQAGGGSSGSAGSGGSQSGQGDRTSAGGAGEGTGQPAADARQGGMQEIESGYDDIVARQLREAAEKETDPELKKKLWEEYRKYKEGIR